MPGFAVALSLLVTALLPPGAEAPALSPGRYALHTRIVGPRSVPLLGDLATVTETWAYVELSRRGNSLEARETACAIVSDGGLFRGSAGAALLAGLPLATWTVTVDASGSLRADLGSYAVGFEGSVLPGGPDDLSVRDPDKNGHPGAAMDVDVWGVGTLHLEMASVWHTILEGRVTGVDVAAGTVRAFSRERILSGLPFAGELGTLRVDERASRFTLARLSDSATGCDDVMAR